MLDHLLFLELTDPHSVKLVILSGGRDARFQGCTSDFVYNCRQNEGDTRASERTNVGSDEDLNDGSNNGATTLECLTREQQSNLHLWSDSEAPESLRERSPSKQRSKYLGSDSRTGDLCLRWE